MSNRLLIPRHLRKPSLVFPRPALILPGTAPVVRPPAPAAAGGPPSGSSLQTGSGTTTNNNGITTSTFNVSAGTMIVVDIARDGPDDYTSASVTNNQGLTFVVQATAYQIYTNISATKSYRIQRWWAYTSGALTGMTVTSTWNGTAGSSYLGRINVTGYANISKANGGTPWLANPGNNPDTNYNVTATATAPTVNTRPQGATAFVCMCTIFYQDKGLGIPTCSGFTTVANNGTDTNALTGTMVVAHKVSSVSQGTTQSCAWSPNQANWALLSDTIDAG